MEKWGRVQLTGCLIDHDVGRSNQINTSDIQRAGRHPVIDQGQAYIAGYTDDSSRVISEGLPYVIFGDHTRCFKYVDFPFVLGADGTKVLKPNPKLFDARFFYYAAMSLDIPNRGYNRHFTLLREKFLPHPNLDEQRRIAGVLSAVQQAIERQERLIALTIELKKALMHKLFTEGTRGEPLKQTEIGPVPESWKLLSVQSAVDNGILEKPMDGNHGGLHPKQSEFVSSGIPFVMASDLVDGTIDFATCNYLTKARADRLQKGFARPRDTLISHKATIGVTAMVPLVRDYVMLTPQVTYYRSLDETRLDPDYLYAYLGSHTFQERFLTVARDGSTRAYIGITKQRDLPMLLPSIEEQKQIAAGSAAVRAKLQVEKRRRFNLKYAFKSLLHQLMTAQIRVHDLDLSALEAPAQESALAVAAS